MIDDPRYLPVRELWSDTPVPAITRDEAERAERLLLREFGSLADYPASREQRRLRGLSTNEQLRVQPYSRGPRRCWITRTPGFQIDKGWARLVHDTSHRVFRARHPSARPHADGHAKLEADMAWFVLSAGWLQGALRPPQPAPAVTRATEMARLDQRVLAWQRKRDRAVRALAKLARKRARLARRADPVT